jgi:HEAT repeat protein
MNTSAAAAVTALASLTSPDARSQLATAAHDTRRVVRLAALAAATSHPSGTTVRLFEGVMTTDPEPAVRRAAVEALGDVAQNDSEAGEDAVSVLVGLLTHADWRQQAASARPRLPADRVASLAVHMRQWDEGTRRGLVETLGRSRHPEATTLLQDALNDNSALVRQAAVLALGRRHVV